MTAPRHEKIKRNTLNLRITPELRGLIDRAAELSGKNRSNFVLDAARHAAEDVLTERTVFLLDSEAYDAYITLLDAPPSPNDRLRNTLHTTPRWET